MSTPDQPSPPLLRVVRGDPSPEQVAALVGVLASLSARAPAAEQGLSPWTGSARRGRSAARPSPSAWRLSMRAR